MIQQAADAIQDADALLICAGAGIGVDSGLPDFRGDDGFWKAYPPLREAGITFTEIASPDHFRTDPALAWGFYGHRLNLYRATVPHHGFTLLKEWANAKPFGGFVFTSNVDGQFQKAGFGDDRITECHGSIHHLQSLRRCRCEIWSADGEVITVDETTLRLVGDPPRCPRCSRIARPNVLMFNDWGWLPTRADEQTERLEKWLGSVLETGGKIAVIEIGAGRAIPTVRRLAEQVSATAGAPLIRINPRDCAAPVRGECVPLPLGSLDALNKIAALL